VLDERRRKRQGKRMEAQNLAAALKRAGLILLFAASAAVAQERSGYVLAASWEPAFCQTEAGERKRECRTQTADRYDATHLSLHGLWPDDLTDKAAFPCYCGSGEPVACDVDRPDQDQIWLSQPVFNALRRVMPGVQSKLHQHEWSKHGACSGWGSPPDPDGYFAAATRLIDALNASPVQALFANHIGERLTRKEIEAAFNQAFGSGAADRLTIRCRGGNISELWINLEGDITPKSGLADLILAAPTTSVSTSDRSCSGGKLLAVKTN
jgi:ribonuclease T2